MATLYILLPFVLVLLLNVVPLRALAGRAGLILSLLYLAGQTALTLVGTQAWNAELPGISSILPLQLGGDALSRVLLLAVGIVGMVALSVGQAAFGKRDDRALFHFVNLLLLLVAGMNGVVLVQDLFSLYVFIEIVGVSSFILIAQPRSAETLEGAFKYLVLSAIATTMMLSAIGLLYMAAGSTSFAAVHEIALSKPAFPVGLAIALYLGGVFVKSGAVPFHGWLPDAYTSAPNAVSVLLAGIVTKVGGIYTLIRLVSTVFTPTPAIQTALLAIGLLSIVTGAVAAMGQDDMKRMLAWSSISQIGYIILGLGAGTTLGLAGAVFHLFNHAIFKTQLFVNAAAVENQLGTRDMERMGGLASRMPWTGGTSVVAFLSTAGIPPLAGFWSKLVILVALYKSGHPVAMGVAVLASLVTLAYFLLLQRKVFFGKLREGLEGVVEASPWLTVPAIALSAITVLIGLFFFLLLDSFILPVQSILQG